MKHTYTLEGMTCSSCEEKVSHALNELDGITDVKLSREENRADIEMSHHVELEVMKDKLSGLGDKYSISEQPTGKGSTEAVGNERSWFETYKPVLLIFAYIFTVSSLIEGVNGEFDVMRWMRHFMAGFFLTFSFFKMLNLEGFKNTYQMYDVIARRIPGWGYVYAFTELLLGIAFLVNFNMLITSSVTFVVMSVSIIGVLQTVLNKQAIQCACLGDVFNLPMSTVTIIEDGLMILMSMGMIYMSV
jgi:copper chaperone CopZ